MQGYVRSLHNGSKLLRVKKCRLGGSMGYCEKLNFIKRPVIEKYQKKQKKNQTTSETFYPSRCLITG